MKVGGVRRRSLVGSVRHWKLQVQVAKRIRMVDSRWCKVRDGGAVLLGNGMVGFHGGAVLLGNGIVGFHGGVVLLGNGIGGFYGGAVLLGNGMAGVFLGNGMAGFHGGAVLFEVVKRIGMVDVRWRWLGDGGAVLLGNVIRDFYVGAV